MRKSIVLLFLLWSFLASSQNTLYCLKDFAGWYRLSTIDPITGIVSEIAPIPALGVYVLGRKQFINTDNDTYTCAAHDGVDARLYTFDLATASVISNPVFNDVVVGLKYNCVDSTVYAIEEVGIDYYLVSVDVTTGLTTQIGIVGGATAYVSDGFSLDVKRGLYHMMGVFNSNIHMFTIDITAGLVLTSPAFPDNVTGLAYNCNDSTVYGIWEDGLDYKLESIDPTNGTHSTVGILNNIDPGLIGESSSNSRNGEYTYRGFSSTNPVLITVDVQNANIISSIAFTTNVSGIDYYNCCLNDPVTGVEEKYNLTLSVFPNPFNNKVKIEWDENINNGTIELLDMKGKIVFSDKGIKGSYYELYRDNLAKGIYIVEIKSQQQKVWVGKLVAD